jgi:hypothetical protein
VLNFLDTYKLIKGQAAFGVEVIFNTKENYTLVAVELKSTQEGIEVVRKFTDITLAALAKENTKNIPLYFSVGGKGVIHKKIKAEDAATDQELIGQVFPNAALKDFYIQRSKIKGFESWVSVVRKEVLDNFLQQIEKLNLFGVQLFLGPFALETTLPFINKMTVITTAHELTIEDHHIIQLDSLGSVSNGEEYDVEGELINSHELIAFGTAFNHFVPSLKITPILSEKVTQFKAEYFYKNKSIVVGVSIVAFFFILVMGNLLIGGSYEKTHNELQYQMNSNREFVEELKTLKKELKIKEQFVQNSGVARASKIAFYTDQIGMSIPKSIQLDQLFVNPLAKRIHKAEDINFNYNTIKIRGTVTRSIDLNDWIKELKGYEWVDEIHIISFIQDNRKTVGEFEIEVTIKN